MSNKKLQKQLDEIFFRRLSVRSIYFLQQALYEYVKIELGGVYEHVSKEIESTIGAKISRYVIEDFAKNENHNDRSKEYLSTPRMQRHFTEFLIVSNFIAIEELALGELSDMQVALRLAKYFGTTDSTICNEYLGTYHYSTKSNLKNEYEIKLTLSPINNAPIISASERTFKNIEEYRNWSNDQTRSIPPKTFIG